MVLQWAMVGIHNGLWCTWDGIHDGLWYTQWAMVVIHNGIWSVYTMCYGVLTMVYTMGYCMLPAAQTHNPRVG
jgi:hypothetical protein